MLKKAAQAKPENAAGLSAAALAKAGGFFQHSLYGYWACRANR